jgi:hypothetical protein
MQLDKHLNEYEQNAKQYTINELNNKIKIKTKILKSYMNYEKD